MKNDPLKVFLHIPKTAGTCIRDLINKNVDGSEIYDPRSGMGLSEDKNNVEVLQRMKIISAHTPVFGRSLGGRPLRYVTMLRSPFERVVSYWGHARRDSAHPAHEYARNLCLADFIETRKFVDTHNHQTRLISGVDSLDDLYRGDYIYNELTYEDLERAKINLAEVFDFVGIQESFYHSYTGISNVLGFPLIGTKPRKKAPKWQKESFQLSKRDREVVYNANTLDTELYNFSKKLFFEACSNIKRRDVALVRVKSAAEDLKRIMRFAEN